jgi:hypothetical protein
VRTNCPDCAGSIYYQEGERIETRSPFETLVDWIKGIFAN